MWNFGYIVYFLSIYFNPANVRDIYYFETGQIADKEHVSILRWRKTLKSKLSHVLGQISARNCAYCRLVLMFHCANLNETKSAKSVEPNFNKVAQMLR